MFLSPRGPSTMIPRKLILSNAATYGLYVMLILDRINPSLGYCPDGWMKHGQKCYGAFMPDGRETDMTRMRWIFCIAHGGVLLKPETKEENGAAAKLLHTRFPLHGVRAIIGLNDRKQERSFKWGDGQKVAETWQNWQGGQPDNNRGGEDCVEILENGKWNDMACAGDITRVFIILCEQPLKKGSCPSGWIRHDRKCYGAFPASGLVNSVEILEKVHCFANNGVLMNTKTQEQHHIALQLIHSVPPRKIVQGVIGLNDRTSEGLHKWSDGTKLTWQNWFEGQPDNGGWPESNEDCVGLRGDGKWNDIPCKGRAVYRHITLCEQSRTASGICPTDWTEYGSKCYAGFPQHRTLLDDVEDMEKIHCIANNGILMNPKTEEENNFALRLLNSVLANSTYSGYFNPGHHEKGGRDGPWHNWAKGEPTKERGEGCAEMYPNGEWADCHCSDGGYTHITLCEKSAEAHMSTTQMTTVKDEVPLPTHAPKNAEMFQRIRYFNKATTFGENPYIVSEPGTNRTAFSMTSCFSKCMQIQDCTALNFSAKRSQCRLFTSVTAEHVQEVENVPDWILYMSAGVSGGGPR